VLGDAQAGEPERNAGSNGTCGAFRSASTDARTTSAAYFIFWNRDAPRVTSADHFGELGQKAVAKKTVSVTPAR
jgi:hypothetical protein